MMGIQFVHNKVLFRNNKVATAAKCCPTLPPCDICEDRCHVPSQLSVVISGMKDTTGIALCSSLCGASTWGCTNLNDTYVVDQTAVNACAWQYDFPSDVCEFDRLTVNVVSTGTQYKLRARLTSTVYSFHDIYFTKTYASKPDCDFSNESISFQSESYDRCNCRSTGASASITAL
jgi:hypothetical protein